MRGRERQGERREKERGGKGREGGEGEREQLLCRIDMVEIQCSRP